MLKSEDFDNNEVISSGYSFDVIIVLPYPLLQLVVMFTMYLKMKRVLIKRMKMGKMEMNPQFLPRTMADFKTHFIFHIYFNLFIASIKCILHYCC